jgi:hypothetical protein
MLTNERRQSSIRNQDELAAYSLRGKLSQRVLLTQLQTKNTQVVCQMLASQMIERDEKLNVSHYVDKTREEKRRM